MWEKRDQFSGALNGGPQCHVMNFKMFSVACPLTIHFHVAAKGRHQNTEQRITKAGKSLLVSLQNLAFF